MEIGKKIKEARITKGLTQEELGKMVGLQKSAIAKYENGRVVNIKRSILSKPPSLAQECLWILTLCVQSKITTL